MIQCTGISVSALGCLRVLVSALRYPSASGADNIINALTGNPILLGAP